MDCAAAGRFHLLGAGHPKHFAKAQESPSLPFAQPSKHPPAGQALSSVIKSPRSGRNQPWMFITLGQHGLMEKLLQSMSPPRGNREWIENSTASSSRLPPTTHPYPPPAPPPKSAPLLYVTQTQTAKVTVHHEAHYCLFSVSAMYWAASCLKQMGNYIFHSAAPTPRLCQAQFVCRHMRKI